MKHLKIAVLALLLIASYSNVTAQDEQNPWLLNFGTNFIDISTPTDKTSGYFGLYDFGGNDVNWMPYLSTLEFSRHITGGLTAGLTGTVNQVDQPSGMGSDVTFFGLDLNAKYNFNLSWWNPFIFAGISENWVGTSNGFGYQFGLGMNFWISDHVGINWTTDYKQVNTSTDFHMFQNNFGVVWKFGRDKNAAEIDALEEDLLYAERDLDMDGILNCCDACPEVPGLAEFDGCPDTDGDGIIDSEDKCPTVAGPKSTKGCPDMDGDGTADKDDACPEVPGPKTNAGCPFKDTDEDGVIDLIDRCVETPGPAENEGCPVVEDVLDAIAELARTVYFDTGKATFKPETIGRLDMMAAILVDFPQAKWNVNGYTDNTGGDALNMRLSEARANAVRNYLTSKGISAANLTAKGYGATNFIESNDTAAGRAVNRRVEVKLAQ
jgi:outer membrane protein OmpA-like peptidoglycan-associated protein